jgi:hypothetical protein
MEKVEENKKNKEEMSLYKFCSLAKEINKDNDYCIIRKKDNLIFNLGKLINYENQFEIERICWHDGPIYKFFYHIIEFANFNKIDDLELVNRFKKLDANSMVYINYHYSNLFIV